MKAPKPRHDICADNRAPRAPPGWPRRVPALSRWPPQYGIRFPSVRQQYPKTAGRGEVEGQGGGEGRGDGESGDFGDGEGENTGQCEAKYVCCVSVCVRVC